MRALACAGALPFLLVPLAAAADLANGQYEKPAHGLAASDSVGDHLFDPKVKKVVMPPRHLQKRHPQTDHAANPLPAWPAALAPPSEDE